MTCLFDALRGRADRTGTGSTPIDGLATVRADGPSGLAHDISRPLVCLVVQGRKRVTLGADSYTFGAGESLLITSDVPTVSQITEASPAVPYRSLVLELDVRLIAELSAEIGTVDVGDPAPIRVEPTDEDVAETAVRLLRLLDRPQALPVLAAPLMREIHYWLLVGRHGSAMRRLGWPDSHAQRIARAVALLRRAYRRPLSVDELAAAATMSPSSFHQHFRAVTSLSPIQFQKQLRLIEARRLMLAEGVGAGSAAYAVGYGSVPQFTRDYGRFFGLPPAREIEVTRRRALA